MSRGSSGLLLGEAVVEFAVVDEVAVVVVAVAADSSSFFVSSFWT